MAWAERTSSGRYRGLYRDASGRRHTARGGPWTRKSDAVREAAEAEGEARRRPGQPGPRAGRLTWGAWAVEWWPGRKVEPGTAARDLSRRTAHLEPRWDNERLDTITRDAVQQWVDELHTGGMAPSTVANVYHLLSTSLKAAVLAGKLQASPCTSIVLPRRPPADDRYLSWDEVAAIAHYLDDRDSLLVWLLVGTGARWGEAVGAHAVRLDVAARRLDIHEVWDQRTREVKPYPKGRTKRSVPLPGWLVDRLTAWLDEHPPDAQCGATHRRGSRCRSGLILPGRDGVPIDYDTWRRTRWAHACARAKVGDVPVGHVRIHDLRHTYASWLIQDGVTLEALCDLLGHASLQTTQRYAHLADTQWETVRAVLDRKSATHLPCDEPTPIIGDRSVRDRRSS